ncbi:MAG: lysophospholipid acyltransferase family protein [Candidatus Ratteibacteria bacterium]|nr:lysophospholipid acyltransferase family protein [Candidatus Ratteibacteria bacterium]
MFYRFCVFICWVIVKVFFRLKVSGRERLPREEAVMIVANHTSFLDPVVIGVAAGRVLFYVARKDLFDIPVFGKLLLNINVMPISRGRFELSVFHKISKLVKGNKAFVIFPEGTRSKTGEIQSGKAGVGLIAWKTRVKIVPAFIKGSYEAWPARAKIFHPAKIEIVFGMPLELNHFYQQTPSRELYRKMADKMMQSIKALAN